MQLASRIPILVAVLVLGGCGEAGSEPAGNAEASMLPAEASQAPDLFGEAEGTVATPASAAIEVNCPERAFCSGPVVVRTENFVLASDGEGRLSIRGVMVIENRTGEEIRAAILADPILLSTDNGIGLISPRMFNPKYVNGLDVCGDRVTGSDCFATSPNTFRTLTPGDSPARVNLVLMGRYDPSLAPTVPMIAEGTLTSQIYVVEPGGGGRVVQVSVPNVQIRNQLAQ